MVNFLIADISFQLLIPFLFVLAVIFGVLELASPIKNRAVSTIIAVAIAAFSYFAGLYTILWQYMPSVTWFFIIMFMIAFVLELFGLRRRGISPEKHTENIIVGGIVLLVLFSIGWMAVEAIPIDIPFIGGGSNIILILGLIFILTIFWAAFRIGPGVQPAPAKEGGG